MRYFSSKIIDSKVLKQNYKSLKTKSNCNICAVVKADAYGHGIRQVVMSLDECDFFAVQNVVEGVKVRKVNKKAKVLVLGYCSDYYLAGLNNLSIMVDSLTKLKEIAKLNQKFCVHLKINTGMNRFGFNDINEFKKVLKIIKQLGNIEIEGLFTHCFCCENEQITKNQLKIFKKHIKICHNFGFYPIIHVGGSKMVNYKLNFVDYVRCGLGLYGYGFCFVKPAMKIQSPIIKITNIKKGEFVGYDCNFVATKDMTIGLVPFGYADGFVNQKEVTYKNTKLKVVGKICMDMFMVDLSNLDAKVGDMVTVFEDATKWVKNSGKSEYQILTSLISARAENIVV